MSWKHIRRQGHRHQCPDCGNVRICKLLGKGHGYSRTRKLVCSKCNRAAMKRWEAAQNWCTSCGHGEWTHKPKCIVNLGAVGLVCECEAYVSQAPESADFQGADKKSADSNFPKTCK